MTNKNSIVEEFKPFFMSNQSIWFVYNRDMQPPVYTNSIPTAAVVFSKTGENIGFIMNKDFMDKCNYDEKCFIFSHEALHVLFDHGKRGEEFLKTLPKEQRSQKLLNWAMDICINQVLIDQYFPIQYKGMELLKTLITFDNFDSKGMVFERGHGFAYYYMEMYKSMFLDENGQKKKMKMSTDGSGFDFDDDEFTTFGDAVNDDETTDGQKSAKNKIHKDNGSETEENHEKGKSHSSNANHTVKEIVTQYKNMGLKDAVSRYVKHRNMSAIDFNKKQKVSYDWYSFNRRNVAIQKKGNNLPAKNVEYGNKKHNVLIYGDVSGSVASYTEKFINIVNYINKEKCNIIFNVWADTVSEVYYNEKNVAKWAGCGGGTNIGAVINNYNQKYKDANIDCVVVLTDGQYDNIKNSRKLIKDPTKWVFFMTEADDHSKNVFDKSTSVVIDWLKDK